MPSLYTLPRVRACQNCSGAKAKCEPDLGYTKCKRCNRQGLECVITEAAPRKRRRGTPANDDRPKSGIPSPPDDSTSTFSRLVELERGLEYYRTSLFQYFPFVVPPDLGHRTDEFANARPFLSLVISMLGCTNDRARQLELALQTRTYLASRVLGIGERSLDIVQGLLLSCHWYHFQYELPNQRSTFLHLAMGMVVDLELNKSPFTRSRLITATETANCFEMRTEGLTDHTLEEKRAFLGVLYLSLAISKCSLNMDAIRFSEYAEQCCELLEKSQLPSDQTLVHLLRLHHVVERFATARASITQRRLARGLIFEFSYDVFRPTSQFEVPAFVEYWDRQLADQWNAIPESAKTQLLCIQHGYGRICLNECCLEESLFSSAEARLRVMRNCMAAIKSMNAVFMPMSEQPVTLLDVPSYVYAQSNHSIFTAIQLCSVKCGDWSATFVERELNLRWIFETSTRRISSLVESAPPNSVPSFYKRLIPMAKGIQRGFAVKMRNLEGKEQEKEAEPKPNAQADQLDLDFLGQFLNLDDNLWLQDLLTVDEHQAMPSL